MTKSVHGDIALVEAKAPRALRHQIRAHFAAIEHPLLGDQLYGGPAIPGLARHALHAHRIAWGGDAVVPAFVVVFAAAPKSSPRFSPRPEPTSSRRSQSLQIAEIQAIWELGPSPRGMR